MRKGLLVNLTPLLDLLLIMVFAYQIQSRLVVASTVMETERQKAEAKETAEHEVEFRRQTEEGARRLREENDRLRERLRELEPIAKTTLEHARDLAKALHEIAGSISEEEFYETLASSDRDGIHKIQSMLDRMSKEPPEQILTFLARTQAFKKHITSWSVRLTGAQTVEILVEDYLAKTLSAPTNRSALLNTLGRAFKELEEPKDLGFVFFSWGRTRKRDKDLLRNVLDHLMTETLRTAYPGKRFHLVVEGYRPEGEQ